MRNSDVDLCLVMKQEDPYTGEVLEKSDIVHELALFLEEKGMQKLTALPNARVPIVKLVEAGSQVQTGV